MRAAWLILALAMFSGGIHGAGKGMFHRSPFMGVGMAPGIGLGMGGAMFRRAFMGGGPESLTYITLDPSRFDVQLAATIAALSYQRWFGLPFGPVESAGGAWPKPAGGQYQQYQMYRLIMNVRVQDMVRRCRMFVYWPEFNPGTMTLSSASTCD